jgi:arsenate reductase (thioredoxin)
MSANRPTVLFPCPHNAGRSQMAAAILDRLAAGRLAILSARTSPGKAIDPAVAEVMRERRIDLSRQGCRPKRSGPSATRSSVASRA